VRTVKDVRGMVAGVARLVEAKNAGAQAGQ